LQNIHVSFLRTVPPYSHQANVWVEMLKQFKYHQIVFIHSSDTDGRALLGRFQTKTQDLEADDQEVKVQVVIYSITRHEHVPFLNSNRCCITS
jgi:ionotropic glutamate receptor NMDA 1